MILFAVGTALSVLFAAVAVRTTDLRPGRPSVLFVVLSVLPLTLLATLRDEVGTDWPIYLDYFQAIGAGAKEFSEPGFNLLNRVVYFFSQDFHVVTFLVAAAICLLSYAAIYRQSVIVPMSILMLVLTGQYFNSMNQLRQALAMAIFLWSFRFVRERKPLPYFLAMAVAISMHQSAALYLPLYFLYGLRANPRVHIVVLSGCLVFSPVLGKALALIIAHTKYGWYFNSVYNDNNFYLVGFVFTLVVLALYLYYLHRVPREDREFDFMVNLQLMAVVVLLFTSFIPQVQRVSECFMALTCLAVPRLILREEDRARRVLLYVGVVALFGAKLLYDVYVNGWFSVIPYQTFLSQ